MEPFDANVLTIPILPGFATQLFQLIPSYEYPI
jgi:hypothetical protein